MSNGYNSFGSLGDFFPDQEVRCMNPRCRNTWTWFKKDGDDPSKPPRRLCPECEARLAKLEDIEVPCKEEGCDKIFKMTAKEQLYAGKKATLEGFCPECAAKRDHRRDMEIPCRIQACEHTWVWTKRDQERNQEKTIPKRLCEKCFEELNKLHDIEVPCKIDACKKTWTYTRMGQLLDRKAGKDESYTPKRMCSDCMKKLKELKPKQIKCRIKECDNTWPFSTYAQLEYYSREGWDAAPPQRMCNECYSFINSVEEKTLHCKNKGCKNDWKYTKRMQLHDKLTKRKNATYRMCPECFKNFQDINPEEVPCKFAEHGCGNTWTRSAYEQLQTELQHKNHNPVKACEECSKFLNDAKTITKSCKKCAQDISFTPLEQLLHKLGKFTTSELCPDCLNQELKENAAEGQLPITHHTHVVKLPSKGAWNRDAAIRELPPFVNHNKLVQLVDAEVVIVVFADELALHEDEEQSWPARLQQTLIERHPEFKTIVVNASIADTGSEQAVNRLKRDVSPFEPNVVLFSFDHGDSKVKDYRGEKGFEFKYPYERVAESLEDLFSKMSAMKTHKLYFTSTPLLPELGTPAGVKPYEKEEWTTAQKEHYDKCLAHAKSMAHKHNVPILDLMARFEVKGKESARKWMKNWYEPNDHGLRNITQWMADYIDSLGLYD